MKVQKHDVANVTFIVALIAGLISSILSGDAELLGRLLETKEGVTVTPAWDDEPQEGEIVTVEITNDGDIIKHSDKLRLQGAIEFTGKKGDKLVLQMTNGVWVEIGRHFVE